MAVITANIVNINASVIAAPGVPQLQQSGAFVSVGGTTLTSGTYQYCSTLAEVTALLSSEGNYEEISYMASSFFAQGGGVGVNVLELGVQGSASAGIAALSTWLTANPNVFYALLTPAAWDTVASTYVSLASNYSSATGKLYFFPTTTSGNLPEYENVKSIWATVPSPTAADTEFQAAGAFYNWLVNQPSAASPLAPMQFRFLFGLTPWAITNNQSTIGTILSDYGNIVYTGAEGGISDACIFRGTMMSGDQAMYWYGADWYQINAKQQVAAAIIQGSNNSASPLVYTQAGINQLASILRGVGNTGISFGCIQSVTLTATPFATYIQQNPSNYAAGIYNGFSATVTPQVGFESITFDINVSELAAA